MTDSELETRVMEALDRAAPDDLQEILPRCGPGKGNVISMADRSSRKQSGSRSSTRRWRPLIAAVLALVLIGGVGGGLYWRSNSTVASVVSLDVNPSIELKVNRNEKVLSCTPMNEDGAVVLYDMGGGEDLKGTKLDVAVNAVVGSLLRNGYLDQLSSAILISVEDGNMERAADLQTMLVRVVDNILKGASNSSSVYSQYVDMNQADQLTAMQQVNSISSGKASLVSQVLEAGGTAYSDDVAARLSALSVEELIDLKTTGESRIPIGISEADRIAQEYAGVQGQSNVRVDADPELDNIPPIYDVEIEGPFGEFDYRIDAFTGEVLSGQQNIQTGAAAGNGTGTGTQSGTGTGTGTQQGSGTGTQTPQTSGDIGVEAAKTAALKHAGVAAGDASFRQARADWDDGRQVYDIEFTAGQFKYDYEILASDGSVLKAEKEQLPGTQQGGGTGTQTPQTSGDIGVEAAKTAALNHAGVSAADAAFVQAKADWDNGRQVYDIEFTAGGWKYDYEIEAASGSVLKSEKEQIPGNGGQGTAPQVPSNQAAVSEQAALDACMADFAVRWPELNASGITGTRVEYDYDDGYYDIQFYCSGQEFDCDVSGTTGAVISWDTDYRTPVNSDHHDDNHHSTGSGTASGDIGADAAKQAALSHAGLTAGQVSGLRAEADWDDGRLEYEVEFRANGYEYDYTIDGSSGAILDHDIDRDD